MIKYRIVIGCFHSRGQNPCKFIWTKKKPFTKEKSSIPTGLVWDTNMATVMSCENALWASVNIHLCSFILLEFVRCHFNGSRNHEIHRSAFRVGVHVRTRPCLPKCVRLQNSRVFFSKSVKKSVKRGVRGLSAKRASLEYAKIRTVLQPTNVHKA